MSTAFLSAGILGQVYAQAVADALGHHWVFGLAAPAFALAAIAIAVILIEPPHSGEPTSLAEVSHPTTIGSPARARTRQRGSLPGAVELRWHVRGAGPLLQTQFRLDHTGVLLVRLAGLPAMLMAPVAGWLIGRYGATRVGIVGFVLAAAGLVAEAISVGALWALVIASVIFVLGVATIVPSTIALVGSRGGSSRAGALALNGLVVFAGASWLARSLPSCRSASQA